MRTDGQTEMTKLIVAFLNFEKVIKNIQYFLCEISCNSEGKFIISVKNFSDLALLFWKIGTKQHDVTFKKTAILIYTNALHKHAYSWASL
jgi:hypothetical protein